jgi:hypothetical protein
MRLIDAEQMEKHIMESKVFTQYFKELVQSLIWGENTVDVVPVVRGEWIVDECDTTDDVPSSSWIDFHCSECNTEYGLEEGQYGWCRDERIPYKYCPNCGAKMESEGNADEVDTDV